LNIRLAMNERLRLTHPGRMPPAVTPIRLSPEQIAFFVTSVNVIANNMADAETFGFA
jgi:hypothetical protein